MSAVYWGIVIGLVALVVDMFICLTVLSPKAKGSPQAPNGKIDEPREVITQPSVGYRRAA